MLKKISLITALTLNTCLGMSTLEVDRYHLQLPAEVGNAGVILDNNKFYLVSANGSIYSFRPENLDADLRGIDPLKLAYTLGIIWNFELNGTTYSSNSICPEAYEDFIFNHKYSEHHYHMVKAAINAKPAGAYLKIYILDNGELGIHLCPRLTGGGWWDWLFGPSDPLKGLKPACRVFARDVMEAEVNPLDTPGTTICCDKCRAYWEKRRLQKQSDPLGINGFNLLSNPHAPFHCDECRRFWHKKGCESERDLYNKQRINPIDHPGAAIHCDDCRAYWERKKLHYYDLVNVDPSSESSSWSWSDYGVGGDEKEEYNPYACTNMHGGDSDY